VRLGWSSNNSDVMVHVHGMSMSSQCVGVESSRSPSGSSRQISFAGRLSSHMLHDDIQKRESSMLT